MTYKIHKAVVIGAGTMGAALAAHLANSGVPVTLLDIVPRELIPGEKEKGLTLEDKVVRNRIVNKGLEAAIKSRPASFFSKSLTSLVNTGNLEDDLDVIKEADWVIEAIVENQGYLPSNITGWAIKMKVAKPVMIKLEAPAGVEIVGGRAEVDLGHLAGRSDRSLPILCSAPHPC